jgi:uncharacterized repeat protein (TIGR03803 family)
LLTFEAFISLAGAQVATTLYSFTASSPHGGLVIDNGAGGQPVLYGTSETNGSLNSGTVFSLTPPASAGGPWTETVLYTFTGGSDGGQPVAGVVASGGPRGQTVLYGTTYNGGTSNEGTVFSLTAPVSPHGSWTEEVLYSFTGGSDGGGPTAGVTIGKDGVLYGTTEYNGAGVPDTVGVVFSLTPPASQGGAWTETVLHSFNGSDGEYPYAGVSIGGDGTLYGTTAGSGTTPHGTVYSLTPPAAPGGSWMLKTLHHFAPTGVRFDGRNPYAGVTIGPGGVLYGTTFEGGTANNGTVYSVTPPASPGGAWTEEVLYSFPVYHTSPSAPVAIGSGTGGQLVLYGTTRYGGASFFGMVYSLTAPASAGGSWTETTLHSFAGAPSDGATPYAGVVIGGDGLLYGTTIVGGTSNSGTVFSLEP